jgi:NADH:ubiquinone oxidoreductase subunit F (NADH-binding)
VESPRLWELPIGTSGQEILERFGGMRQGHTLKAWLPGGGSTGFLLPEHLDLPMDFDTIGQYGSRLGTGLIAVVSERQSKAVSIVTRSVTLAGPPMMGIRKSSATSMRTRPVDTMPTPAGFTKAQALRAG